jgi:hypothetical protein
MANARPARDPRLNRSRGRYAAGPAPGGSRLTGYQDVGQEKLVAKIGAQISIKEKIDCIESTSDRRARRLVACQSWHRLTQRPGAC